MLGGGRYDGLAEALGARYHVPAIGASHLLGRKCTRQHHMLVIINYMSGWAAGTERLAACMLAHGHMRAETSPSVLVGSLSRTHAMVTVFAKQVMSLADNGEEIDNAEHSGPTASAHSSRVAELLRDVGAPWYCRVRVSCTTYDYNHPDGDQRTPRVVHHWFGVRVRKALKRAAKDPSVFAVVLVGQVTNPGITRSYPFTLPYAWIHPRRTRRKRVPRRSAKCPRSSKALSLSNVFVTWC